jgi:hypothetical protein
VRAAKMATEVLYAVPIAEANPADARTPAELT